MVRLGGPAQRIMHDDGILAQGGVSQMLGMRRRASAAWTMGMR